MGMAKLRHQVPGPSAVNQAGLFQATCNDIFRVAGHSYISQSISSSAFQPFGNCYHISNYLVLQAQGAIAGGSGNEFAVRGVRNTIYILFAT